MTDSARLVLFNFIACSQGPPWGRGSKNNRGDTTLSEAKGVVWWNHHALRLVLGRATNSFGLRGEIAAGFVFGEGSG